MFGGRIGHGTKYCRILAFYGSKGQATGENQTQPAPVTGFYLPEPDRVETIYIFQR